MKLKTALNKMFDIGWIGVANVDGALRFAVLNKDIQSVFSAFTNERETVVLVAESDGITQVYDGYTVFKSIDIYQDGSIVVALGKA